MRRRPRGRGWPLPERSALASGRDVSELLEVTGLTVRFGEHTVVDDVSFTIDAGRAAGDDRRVRLGQDAHGAGVDRPDAGVGDGVGQRPVRRQRADRPQRPRHQGTARRADRDGVPEPADRAQPTDAGRQAGRRTAAPPPRAVQAGGDRRRRSSCAPASACPTRSAPCAPTRTSCPAGSASASASPSPWRAVPRCSSPTSRRPPSTSRCRPACSPCSTELIAAEGTALLFITHDVALLPTVADDVVVMRRGVIVERGTADQRHRRRRSTRTPPSSSPPPARRRCRTGRAARRGASAT